MTPLASFPLVSIVIPAYNAEKFFAATLDSVLAQSYTAWEAIIVDDGSGDRTAEIAEAYVGRDARFRYFRQRNAGVGAARNRGIAEARGTYIAPLDADDIWLPEKLAKQVACLEEGGESYGFCYCWTKALTDDGRMRDSLVHWPVRDEAFFGLIFRNVVGCASVPLFRASALRAVGGYLTREEQSAQGCEDWDIALRVAEKYKVGEVPEYLLGYRYAESTMSTNTVGMARSYEYLISSLIRRNPDVPRKLYRWSAGHFYLYLLNIAYFAGDYPACFRLMLKVIAADPVRIMTPTLYRIFPMCILRSVMGKNFLKRDHYNTAQTEKKWTIRKLFWLPSDWIEQQRWRKIREETR